jgi:hypothetical protein
MRECCNLWATGGALAAFLRYALILNTECRSGHYRFHAAAVRASGRSGGADHCEVRSQRGWLYSTSVLDWTPKLIDEERILRDSNVVDYWESALRLLDRYPWHLLSPVSVHPEFRQQIWVAVQRRFESTGDSIARIESWREFCRDTNNPSQTGAG